MKTNLKKATSIFVLGVGSLGLITSFQNCGAAGFESIGELEKQEMILKNNVFGGRYTYVSNSDTVSTVIPVSNDSSTGTGIPVNNGGGTGTGTGTGTGIPGNIGGGIGTGIPVNIGGGLGVGIPVNNGNDTGTGTSIPINNGDTGTGIPVSSGSTGTDIPVKYFCSTDLVPSTPRVVDVDEIFLEVSDPKSKEVICDDKTNLYSDIVNNKKFPVSSTCLDRLTKGESYKVRLYTPEAKNLTIGMVTNLFVIEPPSMKFDGTKLSSLQEFNVLYDKNPDETKGVTHKDCDYKSSPLVALLGDGPQRIELTPPTEGLFFDILGRNAAPAHTKKRISWFANTNHNSYFIALPDARGQVNGIDQLFGDNTYGPDGQFAKNGYLALAKYDDNKDSYITRKDDVFSKLRMWHDTNLDGRASSNELFTLDELKIISIDLKYDKSYRETDAYGNEILMKSAIRTSDGKLHLLFDLWFRTLNK